MTISNLVLVRHCQAISQEPDAPLTETGHRQAQALAHFLADYPIDYITTSEYLRARQSIEPFASQANLTIYTDARLNERTLSAEPLNNWQDVIRDSFDDHNLHVPSGESANQVLRRAWTALDEIRNLDHDLPLIVTHGNLLALVLHSIKPTFGYQGWKSMSNPDVYALYGTGSSRFSFKRIWTEP